MKNIILADVDGVLLDWWSAFTFWMHSNGYDTKIEGEYCTAKTFGIGKDIADEFEDCFNNSITLKTIAPLRDAVKYVRKLNEEHGYVIHCVTAIPDTEQIREWRQTNLETVFGKGVVQRLVCTGSSANKRPILAEYANRGIPWIEDKYQNAVMGLEYGLDTYLIDHDYNREYGDNPDIKRVKNWREIYELLT
jgi:hypothetical protein